MHHTVLNRAFPFPLFVAASLAVVLVIVAGYSTNSALTSTGKSTPLRPDTPGIAAGSAISEDEANRLVWSLPEVQALADQLRARGSRPITYTLAKPGSSVSGTREADYVIGFAADTGDNMTTIDTFRIDAYTKQISVYDPIDDKTVTLDEWRATR